MQHHTQPFEHDSYEDEPMGLISWSLIILGGLLATLAIADLVFTEPVTEMIIRLIEVV